MPVFDFSGASDKKSGVQSECTYTTFQSNEKETSPEKPIMILDNSSRQWKHHSCGIFTNPIKRTSFEFKEDDGVFSADIISIDSRFVSLLKWLGENHINVRLSGENKESGYAVYKIRETAFGGGTKLSAEDGFLQFMIERLLASSAPAEIVEDEDEEETGDEMKLTSIQSITDFMTCAGRTLPDNIRLWARRNLAVARSHEVSPEERRHAQRALSIMMNVQWKSNYFEAIDPQEARRILDEELYGMESVKQRIIETIIQINRTHTLPAYGLLLVGPAGTGKSQIAYAVARILKLHGYRTSLYLVGNPDHRTVEMQRQLDIAAACQVPVVNNLETEEYTTIVDAIFGVGLSRPVEGSYRDVIMALNQLNAWKVAVDIPSGVNGDTGAELGIAFHADLTVTFAFRKAGLCLYPGRKFAGKVIVADVGIYASDKVKPYLWQTEKTDIHFLPDKIVDGNKGTFGKILVVAGSPGMCGAAYLSASGAFAVGIGMVKIVTAEENRIPLQTMLPEAMLDCGDDFAKDLDWCDMIVIGPGLGTAEKAADKVQWFLKAAVKAGKPLVLDADGLNLLARHPEWKEWLGAHVVLTPHMGEMSRLTGKTVKELQTDRIAAARELAAETGAVCVLKDACTVTAAPDGNTWISLAGNPGMATAGSGDVLTGILVGVLAMFLNKRTELPDTGRQAALGVLLHGMAGDLAAKEKGTAGMKAGDIVRGASEVLKNK